jgi:hypothetical protein
MADAYLKEGDTHPTLESTLQNPDLTPANINAATVVLHVRRLRTLDMILEDAAAENLQVGDDTTGMVRYTFEGPLEAGGYLYEWQVTYLGGEVETFPNGGYLTLAVLHELATEAS